MNSIEKILFWQEPINYFLQKAAAGWLLYLWNFFSVLANPAIFLLVFVLYYWNINKDKGARIAYNCAFILLSVNIIKSFSNIRRPYSLSSRIDMLELDMSGTGSSFPSGHSALSAGLYTSLFLTSFKNVIGMLIMILIPIIVATSRMVLGMHYILDVLVGLGLGYGITFIFFRLLLKMQSFLRNNLPLSVILSSVSGAISLVLSILMTTKTISHIQFADLAISLSLLSGLIFGLYMENRFVKFLTRARRAKKVLRMILGVIPIAVAFVFLSNTPEIVGCFLLYFFISTWATLLFPLIGIHSNLFYIV